MISYTAAKTIVKEIRNFILGEGERLEKCIFDRCSGVNNMLIHI